MAQRSGFGVISGLVSNGTTDKTLRAQVLSVAQVRVAALIACVASFTYPVSQTVRDSKYRVAIVRGKVDPALSIFAGAFDLRTLGIEDVLFDTISAINVPVVFFPTPEAQIAADRGATLTAIVSPLVDGAGNIDTNSIGTLTWVGRDEDPNTPSLSTLRLS